MVIFEIVRYSYWKHKLDNLSSIFGKFDRIIKKYGERLAESIKDTEFSPGKRTVRDYKIGIRTGKLYHSIRPLEHIKSGGTILVKVGTDVDYAKYVIKKKRDFLKAGFRKFYSRYPLERELYDEILKEWRK